jgi:hypothetical protein
VPSTPIYAIPYPAASDPADVPLDMQELAERLEVVLAALPYRKLADTVLGAAAPTISLSSIPQTSLHLHLVCYLRGDTGAINTTAFMRFNGDAAANYDRQQMAANGAALNAAESIAGTALDGWQIPAGTAPANVFSGTTIDIPNYAITTAQKVAQLRNAYKDNNATGRVFVQHVSGFWRSAAAITSIVFGVAAGNFAVGSRVTLYGLA